MLLPNDQIRWFTIRRLCSESDVIWHLFKWYIINVRSIFQYFYDFLPCTVKVRKTHTRPFSKVCLKCSVILLSHTFRKFTNSNVTQFTNSDVTHGRNRNVAGFPTFFFFFSSRPLVTCWPGLHFDIFIADLLASWFFPRPIKIKNLIFSSAWNRASDLWLLKWLLPYDMFGVLKLNPATQCNRTY